MLQFFKMLSQKIGEAIGCFEIGKWQHNIPTVPFQARLKYTH
jgi:hypothetical protein